MKMVAAMKLCATKARAYANNMELAAKAVENGETREEVLKEHARWIGVSLKEWADAQKEFAGITR